MILTTVFLGMLLGIAVLWLWLQSGRQLDALKARLAHTEDKLEKIRQLLNEMRGEEEVRRILAEAKELKEAQVSVKPVRYDETTIAGLQQHMERFGSGSTCIFAGDEGLKKPSLYIIHTQNRIGDIELTREIIHVRFRPRKTDQLISVIRKHLPETASKLYIGKKTQPAADRALDFVMPTVGMVELYSDASCASLLERLGVEP